MEKHGAGFNAAARKGLAMSCRIEPFYPVVDSAYWVEQLLPLGVKWIQLRIKQQPEEAIRQAIETSLAVCRRYGAELVVNDYWRLAIECGAPWVHLGQEDLLGASLDAISQAGIKLGVSSHDAGELETAIAATPDYIALGPVFHTSLKVMPWAPQGVTRLTEWKQRIDPISLVAIGGITLARAPSCFAAGADSVAMVSDIIRHPQPLQQTKAWLQATNTVMA